MHSAIAMSLGVRMRSADEIGTVQLMMHAFRLQSGTLTTIYALAVNEYKQNSSSSIQQMFPSNRGMHAADADCRDEANGVQ